MTALAAFVAVIGGLAGAALLRRAWADRQRERASLIVSGWAALAATVVLDAAWAGWVKESAVAVAGIGLATLIDPCANDRHATTSPRPPPAGGRRRAEGRAAARKLSKNGLPCVDAEARLYFRDVLDHVRRVETMASGLRDRLSSVFEFSNLIEQQRTGAITRQLAAWAAILAVPTAIAGIYGMNVEHMPELRSPYGYPITIGVILTICSALYWRFRKARWL